LASPAIPLIGALIFVKPRLSCAFSTAALAETIAAWADSMAASDDRTAADA